MTRIKVPRFVAESRGFYFTAATALLIAVGCLMDVSALEAHAPHFVGFDKVVHVCMYVALTLVWAHDSRRLRLGSRWWWIMLPPTLYGGLIEYLQYALSPFRTGDWFDLLADAVGVLIAWAAVRWIISR